MDTNGDLKQLLLKDLCGRLPYGVIVNTPKGDGHLCGISLTIFGNEYGVNVKPTERDFFNDDECDVKPYLRPMSSMTEEEKGKLRNLCDIDPYTNEDGCFIEEYGLSVVYEGVPSVDVEAIDWLNEHHFDFRNLIERGLAFEAPKDMYETEED